MGKITRFLIITAFVFTGCTVNGNSATIKGKEKPEEVVKKFYSYIAEGGPTTLKEAYKLVSTKNYKLNEEQFKGITSQYSKDMKVNIVSSDVKKNLAIVNIEYSVPSAFGGNFTTQTEIHLNLDEAANAWKIDFTGETYNNEIGQVSKTGT